MRLILLAGVALLASACGAYQFPAASPSASPPTGVVSGRVVAVPCVPAQPAGSIYPEGMRRIREHKRAGHRVLLLTGALDVVVQPLADLLEVEVDCAHLLVTEGRLTGDLQAPPPAGEARAALLEEYAAHNGVVLSESFAYADSLSDLPMLELVGTPVAVNPDARLSQVAGQRGWRTERWRMAPGNWRLPMPDPRSPEYREAVRR